MGLEWKYLQYDQLVQALNSYATEYPHLTKLYSVGKSFEGRELWVLELTNYSTGGAEDKPGVYIDGNHHAGEVAGSAVCLYTIDYVLNNHGADPKITYLLDTSVFYVLPRVSPDGAEFYLTTPYMLRSSVRPYPLPPDEEGLLPEDIDGDGNILQMRINDENGEWKVSAGDPRLMVRRAPDDREGQFYRVYTEGHIVNFNGYDVKPARPKWGLDFNRNYPGNWKPEVQQQGAGPYPFSEPETRAVGDFFLSHPNIAVALSYHTSGGIILRPRCAGADKTIASTDLAAMKAIGERGKELTGYPTWSIFESFTVNPNRPSAGSFIDFSFDNLGIVCFATELWDMAGRADLPKRTLKQLVELTDAEREADSLKLLKWNDEVLSGKGFVPWTAFDHPQLGAVEIGGWLPKTVQQNPPTELLQDECHKNMLFSLALAATVPRLSITKVRVEPLSTDTYRVVVGVENTGFLPTSGSEAAIRAQVARPVEVELIGAHILQGPAEHKLGHLPGRSSHGGFNTTKKVEWLIKAQSGSIITVCARAPRAGNASTAITL
ncbi:MAG: carboxypeptidase [Bacillota bacterium]|nr:MAG: carboxypeptidase [Bacillota bacterium]